MTDVTKLLAIEALVERAREGDEGVLRIAKEKAANGNQFAQWLLKSLKKGVNHD